MCEFSKDILIDKANEKIDPYTIYKIYYISLNGNRYEARYHRARYYYNDTISEENTNHLKNTYHIDYWKCFKNGGAVEIAPNNPFAMIYDENIENVKEYIYSCLKKLAIHHEEIICEEKTKCGEN